MSKNFQEVNKVILKKKKHKYSSFYSNLLCKILLLNNNLNNYLQKSKYKQRKLLNKDFIIFQVINLRMKMR